MALPSAFLSEEQFTCSICLEMFKNPVSTPCGHSFCQSCLSTYWDGRGRGQAAKAYQCPLCKESFSNRPELQINRTLREITEQFKQMSQRGAAQSLPDVQPNLPLCPIHMRGMEFFCRTDNMCVCSVCVEMADHRGHSVAPAQREWHIKKVCINYNKTDMSAGYRTACFYYFDSSHQVIEMTVTTAESRARSLLKELEEEIAALKKRSATLGQLAVSEDYVLFFKTFPALSSPPQAKDWSNVSVSSQSTSEGILRTISQMVERLQLDLQNLPEAPPPLPRPIPKDITLDPSTAHPRLIISADGKQVQCGDRHQPVPDNPERFDRVVCVMAHQGFTSGRHYWEVDVSSKTDWDLGVASRSVIRKGKIPVSPAHGYWFLSLRDRTDYAFRTDPATSLTVATRPSRVGVYIDCDKGLLSFYNVEAKLVIFTYTDSFKDTIHPFFSPCTNKSGQNAAPLVICPTAVTE
uniref:Uncharacterized protein n=1 Tax=Xiphophorus couchianus TaxID=32473 RepID=A0A3B5M037_9TELE